MLEYLIIYLKDDDSVLTKRAEAELLELVAVLSCPSVQVLAVMLCLTAAQNCSPWVCQQGIKLGANHPSLCSLCWHLTAAGRSEVPALLL